MRASRLTGIRSSILLPPKTVQERLLYFDDKQSTGDKKCNNNHYSRGRKLTGNATLVTKVTLKNGKNWLLPYQVLLQQQHHQEKLVLRKDFPINWELRRKREVGENTLADVYDGNPWKEFQNVDDSPSMNKPRNYGFMLNFDFFPADEKPLGLFRWSVLLSNFKSAQVWTVQMGEYHYCRRCSFIRQGTKRFKRISWASCGWVESLVERDQDQSYP